LTVFAIVAGVAPHGARPLLFAQAAQKVSDKLKLKTVAQLDGEWFFSVWDGAKDKTYWVKLGAPRPFGGVSVDAYNPDSNTAIVTSDSGRFIVVMKEPDASQSEIQQRVIAADKSAAELKKEVQNASAELAGQAAEKTAYSRKETLDLIKPAAQNGDADAAKNKDSKKHKKAEKKAAKQAAQATQTA